MQKFIAGSLLLAGFNAQSQAQENPTDNSLELPNMVVTATRSEVAKNKLAAATTVYTRKDIVRLQVQTLPDLLKGTSGIDMTQQGGYGKIASVFMRGTNPDQLLVLIDGIKAGSVTTGTTPFEFIPIDQIERVEIIKGPQSSLYGSEAMGGVIQIFTRKGKTEDKPSVSVDAGGGSYKTFRVAGTVSGRWKNTSYTLGSSGFGSHGFNARDAIPGPYVFYQPDNDGYDNAAVNARLGHHFDNNAEIEAFFMRAQGHTDYDGMYQDKTDFVDQVAGTSGSLDIMENWRSTLRLGQTLDDNDQYAPDGAFSSKFNSTRWNASWLNQFTLTDEHQLLLGSDYRLDEVDSTEQYTETSRYDVGVFTELHSQLWDDHFVNASVRYDHNEAFGDAVTGNFGWRYNWDYGISMLGSFGNAFKAPSFNDLYFPFYGNPNLKAEESTSFETGLVGNHDWVQWEIRAYHTDIDNLITPTLKNPDAYEYTAENIGKAQIDGIETEIGTQWLGWNGKLSMNLLSPKNRETNARLPRRAEQTLAFDLSRTFDSPFGAFDVGANVLAQSDRYDNPQNTIKVAGYVTVDLRTAYHLNKNWMVSAKLNNLLDKNYQTVDTYNMPDRNFFVSIHYNN